MVLHYHVLNYLLAKNTDFLGVSHLCAIGRKPAAFPEIIFVVIPKVATLNRSSKAPHKCTWCSGLQLVLVLSEIDVNKCTHICTVSAVHQVKVSLVVGAKLAAVTSP